MNERPLATPFVSRKAVFVCVTNDYQRLNIDAGAATSDLLATSCHRFQRVETLLRDELPQNAESCFSYLSDSNVKMHITVQQLVFRATTGEYWIKVPGVV